MIEYAYFYNKDLKILAAQPGEASIRKEGQTFEIRGVIEKVVEAGTDSDAVSSKQPIATTGHTKAIKSRVNDVRSLSLRLGWTDQCIHLATPFRREAQSTALAQDFPIEIRQDRCVSTGYSTACAEIFGIKPKPTRVVSYFQVCHRYTHIT